jgi:hypothetical protein
LHRSRLDECPVRLELLFVQDCSRR